MKKTRVLVLLLSLIMLLIPISCAKEGGETDTTTTTVDSQQTSSDTTVIMEEQDEYPENNLPDGLDFGGETLDMLASEWQGYQYYFFAEDINGDVMNDAVYHRKVAVEEALKIKLVTHQDGFNIVAVANNLKQSVLSGDSTYDLVFNHCIQEIATMVSSGYLYNLDTMPYLNMQADWWNKEQMDALRLGKNTYFAVNDMMIPTPYVIYFNKDMIAQENMENPYQLVYDGDWTLEKMGEMATHVSTDLNGDGVRNQYDRWGLVAAGHSNYISFMTGAGQFMTERDADGRVQLAMNTERMNAIMAHFAGLVEQQVIWRSSKTASNYIMMDTGRILFEADALSSAETLRNIEVDYGILPYPKFDKEQENYISLDWGGLLSVPNNIQNPDMVGAAMEMLAWESARDVLPAYYDVVLTGKLSRDEDATRMLDLLFDTIAYEIGGNYFGFENGTGDLFYVLPRQAVEKQVTSIASVYKTFEKVAKKTISMFYDKLETVESK